MRDGPDYLFKEVTLSMSTAQYGDGDVLAAPQELTGVFEAGRAVELHSLVLLDKDDQGGALDIVLLRSNVSLGTENAALAVTDAAADEILGKVSVGTADYTDLGSSQFVQKTAAAGDAGMGLVLLPDGGSSLYVAAISRDTKTYTATGITLKLGFERP
jgi:hypothetical protein